MQIEWWENDDCVIAELDNDINRGLTTLAAREVDGKWEYAVVGWWHGVARLILLFSNGAVSVDNTD